MIFDDTDVVVIKNVSDLLTKGTDDTTGRKKLIYLNTVNVM
jgi:hypothetical protein